jgi:hypothetical protein
MESRAADQSRLTASCRPAPLIIPTDSRTSLRVFRNYILLRQLVAFQKRFRLLELPLPEIRPEFDRNTSSADTLHGTCSLLFLAIFVEARELQDCYCAGIGLCRASSSRMIDRISPTIRNEPVTRIQPRHRANADAHITASRGCESSSAARSSSSAKRRSSPGAHNLAADVDARISATVSFSGATNQGVAALSFEGLENLPTAPSSGAKDGLILPPKGQLVFTFKALCKIPTKPSKLLF